MARPLRIEFPGASYHVTARGNAQQAIVRDDEDRALVLACLSDVVGGNKRGHSTLLLTQAPRKGVRQL